MHENKFEKGVQQKMEELSFVPSPPVWQRVEAEIRKKRDRRRLILWLLPLVLITAGTGAWFFTKSNSSLQKEEAVITKPSHNPFVKNLTNKDLKNSQPKKKENKSSVNLTAIKRKNSVVKAGKIAINPADFETPLPKNKTRQPANEETSVSLKEKETITGRIDKIRESVRPAGDKTDSSLSNGTVITPPKSVEPDIKKENDSVAQKSMTPLEKGGLKDSTQKKKIAITKKWEWSLAVKGGISGIRGALLGNGSKALDVIFAPSPNIVNAGTTNRPPSTEQSSTAFSIGVDLRRKISSRSSFITGLHYALYRTRLKVGRNVARDTTFISAFSNRVQVENFYTNDAQTDYHNRYHFIEVPLRFDYRLFKKLPLQWQAGISVTQLLSADALLYNKASNVYYKEPDAYRKRGMQLTSGFMYQLWKKEKISVAAGPQVQYSLTPLYRKATSNNQYLFFTGINTNISF
jgi:hypothetical protein